MKFLLSSTTSKPNLGEINACRLFSKTNTELTKLSVTGKKKLLHIRLSLLPVSTHRDTSTSRKRCVPP